MTNSRSHIQRSVGSIFRFSLNPLPPPHIRMLPGACCGTDRFFFANGPFFASLPPRDKCDTHFRMRQPHSVPSFPRQSHKPAPMKSLATPSDQLARPRFGRRTSCLAACLLGLCSPLLDAQTYHNLALSDFSADFDDIGTWTNPSTGSWSSVATGGSATIPDATRITTSSANFVTGSSGGIQRGTDNLQFLSTGSSDNTSSVALDLNLNATNRDLGNLTFDAACVFNSTGNRLGTLRVYYSSDNTTWSELTGTNLPFIATNNVVSSASISASLPPSLDGQATVKLRFYYHNGPASVGSSGSRPKISVDNVLVTSIAMSDTSAPTITSRVPAINATGVPITTNLAFTFNEAIVKGTTGDITLKLANNDPVATIPVTDSAVVIDAATATVTVTLPASLSYSTGYYVNIAAGAFKDTSDNNFEGILDTSWNFTTEAPDITGPVPTSFIPASAATNVTIAPDQLKITFDEPVTSIIGAGPIELREVIGGALVESYDNLNSAAVADGNVLDIIIFSPPALDYETAYYISVPAGTVEDALGNDNLAFGAPASTIPWTFTTQAAPVPPTVVVNKYANIGGGTLDLIELLVIGNETPGGTLDMRGMIVKDFSSSMANDSGGKFEFSTNALWEAVPVGTLIVLNGGTSSPDTDAADFKLEVGLGDATYFTNLGGTFDIATTDMVMIKASGSGAAGVTGGIHAAAAGSAGAQFNAFTGPKLIATGTTGTGRAMFANNSTSDLADYSGTDATGDVLANTLVFGAANNTANTIYISELRGTTLGDGDGAVILANLTPASPVAGSPVFISGATGQTVRLTLNATIPSVTLTNVSILVPTDFGAPGGVTLSGPAATSAGSSITGQTVTITGAAATIANELVVTITGLQAPVPAAGDYGSRSFAVTTSVASGTPTALAASPLALVTIPISKLRDTNANGVPLAINQQVAVVGVNTEENFSTTNIQANIQDSTAGVALFSGASAISPFVRGNRYAVYGPVGQFNGLTQVNYTGLVDLGADTVPAPVILTIPALLAAAETYEGSLVTVENLSFVSGTWGAAQTVVLQDGSANSIDIRIQAGSTATTTPGFPVTVTGVLGQFDTSSPLTSGYQLMPRDPADLNDDLPPGNTFATWIGTFDFSGFTNPDLTATGDPDNDGLDNALENIFGTSPAVFSQGLSAVSASTGQLKFRHTRNATPASDLTASYEWSPDLVNWYASAASAGGVTVTFATPTVEAPGPPELVEVTANITGTAPKVFARVKVVQN
jgi:hypothetical protein